MLTLNIRGATVTIPEAEIERLWLASVREEPTTSIQCPRIGSPWSGGVYAGVALVLVASVLTLVAMLRIWHAAFWRPAVTPPRFDRPGWHAMAVVAALFAAGSLGLGLCAEPVYRLARTAAVGALAPAAYVQAVQALAGKEDREAPP